VTAYEDTYAAMGIFHMDRRCRDIYAKPSEYLVTKGNRVDIVTGLRSKPSTGAKNWDKEFEVINGVNVYRVKTLSLKYVNVFVCLARMIAC